MRLCKVATKRLWPVPIVVQHVGGFTVTHASGHCCHITSSRSVVHLSDIFEYLDPTTCRELYSELLAVARPGSRLAYWNTFVPRRCPPKFADRVTPLTELSERLFARDLAFFYCNFWVDEVM